MACLVMGVMADHDIHDNDNASMACLVIEVMADHEIHEMIMLMKTRINRVSLDSLQL